MAVQTPRRIRVRMYQVGFGDCFLLSFEYAHALPDGRAVRHVLIDFGTMRKHPKWDLAETAELLVQHVGEQLDAIVVTHRHQDHLSAFGNPEVAAAIGALKPKLIVRPWTEDPEAAADATSLAGKFIHGLSAAQSFAAAFEPHFPPSVRGLRADIRELALQQLANENAVTQLNQWATAAAGTYVHIGATTGLEALLPGVTVTALGPPTIEQWPDVMGRRDRDPEYWMLLGQQLDAGAFNLAERIVTNEQDEDSTTDAPITVPPGQERWLVTQMEQQQLNLVQRIVESMDEALNNTSVILLFEVGKRRLLFPGDAQIENWEYVLNEYEQREALLTKLERIDLYKVGHHGSRNATPKSALYGRWLKARDGHSTVSLMSTKAKVHGKSEATKVPRATLVDALRTLGTLYSTHELLATDGYLEVVGDVGSSDEFQLVTH